MRIALLTTGAALCMNTCLEFVLERRAKVDFIPHLLAILFVKSPPVFVGLLA